MKTKAQAHIIKNGSTDHNGANGANTNPRAILPGETLAQAMRRLEASGALRVEAQANGARAEAISDAEFGGAKRVTRAAHVSEAFELPEETKATDVSKETEDTQESKVPEDSKDTDDPEETEDLEDTKDTEDTQEPQDTNKITNKMANRMANRIANRSELVELGRKYSKSSFNERSAFFLAANVMALETHCGELPLAMRKLAFDAATEKIEPDRRCLLFAAYLAAFKKVKKPMTGNTIVTALANVAGIGLYELPEIPGYPLAGEPYKRILALHREMSILSGGKEYYLSRRAMEEVTQGKMKRYEVLNACALLEAYGLIKIIDRGTPGKGPGKGAARYLYTADESDEPLF